MHVVIEFTWTVDGAIVSLTVASIGMYVVWMHVVVVISFRLYAPVSYSSVIFGLIVDKPLVVRFLHRLVHDILLQTYTLELIGLTNLFWDMIVQFGYSIVSSVFVMEV